MPLPDSWPVQARFQSIEDSAVRCGLCPHNCLLQEGQRGLCGVREVRSGTLVSLVYGDPISGTVDPIEKKPLFHFLPGSPSFSYATVGCNLSCSFCQNHRISQHSPRPHTEIRVPAAKLVEAAEAQGSRIIAHTYTEPTVYYEYAYDVARLAAGKGLRNVLVSNGYIDAEPMREIAPYVHGVNVDLKAFSDSSYREVIGGRLQPVLETIELLVALGLWVEVTTLVIPGFNDRAGELRAIARFLAGVKSSIPWHISRFHPDHRYLNAGITPRETIARTYSTAREEGLEFVYGGNLRDYDMEQTRCPSCRKVVIERHGFSVGSVNLENGCCLFCGHPIAGVWTEVESSDF